jgi:hypothetical protein
VRYISTPDIVGFNGAYGAGGVASAACSMLFQRNARSKDYALMRNTAYISAFTGWQIAVLLVLMLLLASIPIWANQLPPLGDYVNHLARVHVIATISSDPDLARFYEIDWQIIPNMMMDLTVPPLTRVMTVYHRTNFPGCDVRAYYVGRVSAESRFVWPFVTVTARGFPTSLQLHFSHRLDELYLWYRAVTLGAGVLDLAARASLASSFRNFHSVRHRAFLLSSFRAGDLRRGSPCGRMLRLWSRGKEPPIAWRTGASLVRHHVADG